MTTNIKNRITVPSKPDSSAMTSRRQFLKAATAGAIAGVAAPIFSGQSAAFAADKRSGKVLIAYFSRTGTTREVASQIRQNVGGELFELRTEHSYPKEYRATTNQAKEEKEASFRPKLTAEVQNMASYSTIFIGFPNWWGTMPMVFFTFLERYDLAGKTVIPFCTHEGSRFGNSLGDIRSLCPRSTILDGLALRGGGIGNVQTEAARKDVADWLKKIGMLG